MTIRHTGNSYIFAFSDVTHLQMLDAQRLC